MIFLLSSAQKYKRIPPENPQKLSKITCILLAKEEAKNFVSNEPWLIKELIIIILSYD